MIDTLYNRGGKKMDTADYLDALRKKFNKPSDYALKDILGFHRQEISNYRTKKRAFGRDRSLKIAELLDLDAAQVFADMEIQRTKCPAEKEVWKRISKTFGHAASLVFVGFLLTSSYGAGLHSFAVNNIHYTKYRLR